MKTWMRMAFQAIAVASLLSFSSVFAQGKPAMPDVQLPTKMQGQPAITALGSNLPAVAAAHRMSPQAFEKMLREDRSVWLDTRGRAHFVDPIPTGTPPANKPPGKRAASLPQQGADSLTLTGALAPLDQTFKLHSKPGASRTIYLNFVGKTVTNTVWTGSNTIYAPPFDFDGAPNTFSQAELERIQYIWQRVAEDYAPFDVDVTTELQQDRITRTSSGDTLFGTEVLITSYNAGLYTCSCGGVAYLGVFDDVGDYSKPALVFYDKLGGGNEKYVAEAISHEAGHNVGLSHDGTLSGSNYYGGANGWAPIMGVGYYQNMVTWSKGEYADANNTQDDYAVMGSFGLPVRADDHGNSVGSATQLQGSMLNGYYVLVGSGVVESPSDVDFFSFSAGAGNITVTAAVAARSSNLIPLLRLYDSNGVVLQEGASINYTVATAGTYYVSIQGVGSGDPLNGGIADYGSLGEFAVTISTSPPASLPPTAVLNVSPTSGYAPLTVNVNSTGSTDPDGTIVSYEWNFGDGQTASGPAFSKVYTTPGTYVITLKVTDNSGMSATKSATVTVNAVVLPMTATVVSVTVSNVLNKGGNQEASALIRVTSNGSPVSGATVTGNWTGSLSGTGTGTTGANGEVTIVKRGKKLGAVGFVITSVTKTGYVLQ